MTRLGGVLFFEVLQRVTGGHELAPKSLAPDMFTSPECKFITSLTSELDSFLQPGLGPCLYDTHGSMGLREVSRHLAKASWHHLILGAP